MTTMTITTNIRVSYKVLGVRVGTNKATKKLAEEWAIREVVRAVNRWFYSR